MDSLSCFIRPSGNTKHNFKNKYKDCNLKTNIFITMSRRFLTCFFLNINLSNDQWKSPLTAFSLKANYIKKWVAISKEIRCENGRFLRLQGAPKSHHSSKCLEFNISILFWTLMVDLNIMQGIGFRWIFLSVIVNGNLWSHFHI